MSDSLLKFTLSPAEWLAVFPRAPNTSGQFPDSLSSASSSFDDDGEKGEASRTTWDPANKLREEYPIDSMVIDRTLAALDAPGLAFQVHSVADWLASFSGIKALLWFYLAVTTSATCLVLFGLIWPLNDGLFGAKQLVAGFVAQALLAMMFTYSGIFVAIRSLGNFKKGLWLCSGRFTLKVGIKEKE